MGNPGHPKRWPNLPWNAIRCERCGGLVVREKDEWGNTFSKCQICGRENTAVINRTPCGWRTIYPKLIRAVAICQRRQECPIRDVAARFGVDRVTIHNWRVGFGLPPSYDNRGVSRRQRRRVADRYLAGGCTMVEAAALEGLTVSRSAVWRWVKDARIRSVVK